MQPEIIEAEAQHLGGRLACQAASVIVGVQDEADLAQSMRRAGPDQDHVADDPAGLTQLHRQGQPIALGLQRDLSGAGSEDRKRAVEGKSVSVRVDTGDSRIHNKKNKYVYITNRTREKKR